jgi:serine/threonine protein kinase
LLGLTLAGKYRLEEYVGSGGMGVVYRALPLGTGHQVAVKILKPDIVANDRECARLFEQEVEAVRRLEHPNIVRLLDSGDDQGYSYMVMEWLEGETLEEVVSAGQLSLERIDHIFAQICAALDAAHNENIIHLDVKPGNIFLLKESGPGDFVKVIDFGMSRVLTRESGTTVTRFRGTYQYCAPEQFGGRVSSRSDVYSLGATLYHLLTGVVPFGTSYVFAKMHRDRELPPLPAIRRIRSDVPAAVERVVKKALSKNPDKRYQSVRLLYEDFHQAVDGATTRRLPPRLVLGRPPANVPTRLKSASVLWSALSLAALVGLAVFFYVPFDGRIPGQNEPSIFAPSPDNQASSVSPQGADRGNQTSPSSDVSRPVTLSSISSTVDNAAPHRSTAIESGNRPEARISPALDPGIGGSVEPPQALPPSDEYVEHGEVVVPPSSDDPPLPGARSTAPPVSAPDDAQRLLTLINEERRKRGLGPLSSDGELSKVAEQHAQNMARGGYLSHVDRDGHDLKARAQLLGLRGWKTLGENIAYNQGYNDPTGFAFERWMASEKHRENILSKDYTAAGVGIARADDGTTYFTQIFMKR